MVKTPSNINIKLPITITKQVVNDGCVTASLRGIIPHLGIDFNNVFLPQLQSYSMNSNPEDNHMLGIATVGANNKLSVAVHTADPLAVSMRHSALPSKAEGVHTKVVKEINELSIQNKIDLLSGQYDIGSFRNALVGALLQGQYAFVFLNWKKWNPKMQEKWGNSNHIPVVFGINNSSVLVMDPTVEEGASNLVEVNLEYLFNSLNKEQQIVFLGKRTYQNLI